MNRGRIVRWGLLGATTAVLLMLAPPVGADHAPGAVYTGRMSVSGPVKLVVAKDGAGLASFRAEFPCSRGENLLVEETFAPGVVPITNHAFAFTVTNVSVTGTFSGAGAAAGTLHYDLTTVPNPGSCTAGDLTWTATVDAAAPQVTILDDVLVLSPAGVVYVRLLCPEGTGVCAGDVRLETERGVVLGAKRFRAGQGKTKIVDIAFFARGLKAVAGRTLRARIVVRTRDDVGNEETSQRTVRLKAGLPDLYVAAFVPSKEEGDICRGGEVHNVRWTVHIRNLGPGVGPAAFQVRVGTRVVTVRRRLAVRKRIVLDDSVPGRIRIVVDPGRKIEESNERNNALRSPSPETLVCRTF